MPFTQLFTLAPSPETPELPFFMCVPDTIASHEPYMPFSLNDIFRLNLS